VGDPALGSYGDVRETSAPAEPISHGLAPGCLKSLCPCCPVLVVLASMTLGASAEVGEMPLAGKCAGQGLLERSREPC